MKETEPLIAWPGWAHMRFSALLVGANTLWFLLIYGGCDWITSHRAFRVRLDFDWERNIPFIPAATVVYMSVYAMFALAPFVLRDRRQMRKACAANAAVIAIAGICFLLFPADLAYPPPPSAGVWQRLFDLADLINLDHNLAPSLHVALSSLTALLLAAHAPRSGKYLFLAWALAISASTLLTHQHHVIDVLTGNLLAAVAYFTSDARLVHSRQGGENSLNETISLGISEDP